MAAAFYLPDANVSVQHHASTIGEQPLEMLICRVVRCIGPVYIQRINYLTGSHVVGWPDLCTDFKHVACEDVYQGWEFAHWFSERIACILPKNLQMSNLLKKMSDSLIFGEGPEQFTHDRSFPLYDLSKLLMVDHF